MSLPQQGALVEMSMHITKAVQDGKVMKWSATNSDTDPDSYTERMSLELYKDFIAHIDKGEQIPEVFRSYVYSNYWKGGMPYVSISHYPDVDGQAVPGEVKELFIDGDVKKARLKARGVLHNTPLGNSVFRSLQEDKYKSPEDKIRISIGFLDLGHRHGDNAMWERKSLTDACPDCLNNVGNKVYCKGYLIHLALTRVPVNKRTEMVLEEKSEMATKKTRKEDAASIVGEDLATEIDVKAKAATLKSDVLVEMSEGEENPAPVEEVAEETPVEEKAEVEAPAEVSEPVEEKANAYLPYNGATSMKEAQKAKEAIEEMSQVMDLWGMFSNVAWNIIDTQEIVDKKAAFVKALDEFKGMLAAKAMVEFGMIAKSETVLEAVVDQTEPHQLKPALDALLSAVDNSLVLEGDVNAKLQYIQPTLQELGEAITEIVKAKSVVANEPPAPDKNNDNLLEKITELIQPLSLSVQQLSDKVGVLEAKSNATAVEQPRNRIPQPRSLPANLVQKSEPAAKPGSLRSIINKSVGITE